MTKKYIPYSEKLKDQRWQKKRLELLEAADWKCQAHWTCVNEIEKPSLHVHHRIYLRNLNPWEYEDWAYQVLCDKCHEAAQLEMSRGYEALAKYPHLLTFCAHLLNRKEAVNISEDLSILARSIADDLDYVEVILRGVTLLRSANITQARLPQAPD